MLIIIIMSFLLHDKAFFTIHDITYKNFVRESERIEIERSFGLVSIKIIKDYIKTLNSEGLVA